jgi:hypothetical protein
MIGKCLIDGCRRDLRPTGSGARLGLCLFAGMQVAGDAYREQVSPPAFRQPRNP